MADKHAAVIERFTTMMRENGLALPDEIERGEHSVRFLWTEQKVAVVVDLEDGNDA